LKESQTEHNSTAGLEWDRWWWWWCCCRTDR